MGGVALERRMACGHQVHRHQGLAPLFFTLPFSTLPSFSCSSSQPHHDALHIFTVFLWYLFLHHCSLSFCHKFHSYILSSSLLFLNLKNQLPFWPWSFSLTPTIISTFETFKFLLLKALISHNLNILKSNGIKLVFRESSWPIRLKFMTRSF